MRIQKRPFRVAPTFSNCSVSYFLTTINGQKRNHHGATVDCLVVQNRHCAVRHFCNMRRRSQFVDPIRKSVAWFDISQEKKNKYRRNGNWSMQLMMSTNTLVNHRYHLYGCHHDATIDTTYQQGSVSVLVAASSPDYFVRNVGYLVSTYFKQFFISMLLWSKEEQLTISDGNQAAPSTPI